LDATGRITIFTITNCVHCRRVKAALNVRGPIPYVEINLTEHAAARAHMVQLSNRSTVPQVFFNDEHIGGADETLELLENNKWHVSCALDTYEREIAAQPDPTDERLQRPAATALLSPAPPRPLRGSSSSIRLPNDESGKQWTVLEMTTTLQRILPDQQTVVRNWTGYRRSFTGHQAVSAFQQQFAWFTVDDAVELGRILKSLQILHQVHPSPALGLNDKGHERVAFDNSNAAIYRLQCRHTPAILNSFCVWTDHCDVMDVMALQSRLRNQLNSILQDCADVATGRVSYRDARRHADYESFEEAVCELQTVDLFAMDVATRTAFIINVYNLMIDYAFVKVGIATSAWSRGQFFNTVSVTLSGLVFTLNDLEHGILRGNRPPPYARTEPFGPKDPRRPLALPCDCRVHFALNCGAKSCPPVEHFTASALDEELRIVAESFCEPNDNARLVESANGHQRTLLLSKIMYWYQADFAPSLSQLPTAILPFLRGEKQQQLENAIRDQSLPLKVKFLPYDWSTKASDYTPFDKSALLANVKSLWKIVSA
jgi:glutaredoxin